MFYGLFYKAGFPKSPGAYEDQVARAHHGMFNFLYFFSSVSEIFAGNNCSIFEKIINMFFVISIYISNTYLYTKLFVTKLFVKYFTNIFVKVIINRCLSELNENITISWYF